MRPVAGILKHRLRHCAPCALAPFGLKRARSSRRRAMAEPSKRRAAIDWRDHSALAVAALAAVGALLLVGRHNDAPAQSAAIPGCDWAINAAAIGGPIDLVDSNGSQSDPGRFFRPAGGDLFRLHALPGCLARRRCTLTDVLAQPTGYDVQPILITADPTRDTPEVMRAYTHTSGVRSAWIWTFTGRPEAQVQPPSGLSTSMPIARRSRARRPIATMSTIPLLYVVDDHGAPSPRSQPWQGRSWNDPRSPMVPTSVQNLSACIAAGLGQADG